MSNRVVPTPVQAAAVCSNCAPYCCLLPEFCGGQDRGNSIYPILILVAFPCSMAQRGCAEVRPVANNVAPHAPNDAMSD